MKYKFKDIIIIFGIFIVVCLIGYGGYSITQNFDNEKEVDTTEVTNINEQDKVDEENSFRTQKTISDPKGKTYNAKNDGKLNFELGAYDIVCKNPKKNLCSGAIVEITSPDDKDLKKAHPIGEYVLIDGKKDYNYHLNSNGGKTKGIIFRKRKDN